MLSEKEFHLIREMRETARIIADLDIRRISRFAEHILNNKVLITGEGSSRLFPAKKARYDSMRLSYNESIQTEGATQCLEYDLAGYTVLAASNSGKTKEVVRLLRKLKEQGHKNVGALTAGTDTPVEKSADFAHILISGAERAVAATKTVVEQTLVYDIAFRSRNRHSPPDLKHLSSVFSDAFEADTSDDILATISSAATIYWAGRNDGVAEELTLKTNELTRKPADFLEGTYAVHGIEEIMSPNDVVILVSPFEGEEKKFAEVLIEGVGLNVVAISSKPTSFPTILIPDAHEDTPYVALAAGWRILVDIGLRLGIDLDKPERARKVGNEFGG